MFGSNLFLSDKIVDSRFCDCENECLRDQNTRINKGIFTQMGSDLARNKVYQTKF